MIRFASDEGVSITNRLTCIPFTVRNLTKGISIFNIHETFDQFLKPADEEIDLEGEPDGNRFPFFAVDDFWFVTRILKRQTVIGLPTMIGSKGKVASPLEPEGLVTIKSELWGATAVEGNIGKGEEVTVTEQEGLKLTVSRINTEKSKRSD